MFVTFEGIEGSGKSTLLAGLAERLSAAGHDVFTTREPGGTPLGDAVRAIFLDVTVAIGPLTEAMLVNAARAQHVTDAIRPALDAGKIVLCDRFVDSTIAYQGYGRGLDLALLQSICDAATSGLEPDLTFLLDIPLDISRSRTRARRLQPDRLEAEDDGFHDRVRRGFLEIARKSPRHRVLVGTMNERALVDQALRAMAETSSRADVTA